MNVKEAILELRKNEKRKFDQTIDLIINLKGVDPKKDNITAVIGIPNKIKEKKICGFLNKKSDLIDSITQPEFMNFKDKKQLKMLVKKYDYFVASGKLMPSVATTFGKILGPAGKMPTPALGVLMQDDDNTLKLAIEKIGKSVKIRVKEASVKVAVAREGMKDEQIAENIEAVYNGFVNVLPTKRENVKSAMIKLTMSKPVKVEVK